MHVKSQSLMNTIMCLRIERTKVEKKLEMLRLELIVIDVFVIEEKEQQYILLT